MDHFFRIRLSAEPPEAPMLESYATLAFIAGITPRARLDDTTLEAVCSVIPEVHSIPTSA
jgi:hypothetical protein